MPAHGSSAGKPEKRTRNQESSTRARWLSRPLSVMDDGGSAWAICSAVRPSVLPSTVSRWKSRNAVSWASSGPEFGGSVRIRAPWQSPPTDPGRGYSGSPAEHVIVATVERGRPDRPEDRRLPGRLDPRLGKGSATARGRRTGGGGGALRAPVVARIACAVLSVLLLA